MDIIYGKKDVIVNIETEVDKSLIYQAIFLVNLRHIVLMIIFTIMFM